MNPEEMIGVSGALVLSGFKVWHTKQSSTNLSTAALVMHIHLCQLKIKT